MSHELKIAKLLEEGIPLNIALKSLQQARYDVKEAITLASLVYVTKPLTPPSIAPECVARKEAAFVGIWSMQTILPSLLHATSHLPSLSTALFEAGTFDWTRHKTKQSLLQQLQYLLATLIFSNKQFTSSCEIEVTIH